MEWIINFVILKELELMWKKEKKNVYNIYNIYGFL